MHSLLALGLQYLGGGNGTHVVTKDNWCKDGLDLRPIVSKQSCSTPSLDKREKSFLCIVSTENLLCGNDCEALDGNCQKG